MKEKSAEEKHVAVTFTNEDLLLGTVNHNRSLYVSGIIRDTLIKMMLIDPGSSINIITVDTLKALCLDAGHLTNEKVRVQGFDSTIRQTLGAIELPLEIGNMKSRANFHVIDASTPYKILLGRPWIHDYGVVPSTLHQCFKFKDSEGEHRISGEIQPFSCHEIHLEEAKFFLEEGNPQSIIWKAEAPTNEIETPSSPKEKMIVNDSSEEEEVLFSIASTMKKLVISDSEDETEKVASTQGEDTHVRAILTPEKLHKSAQELEVANISHITIFIVVLPSLNTNP